MDVIVNGVNEQPPKKCKLLTHYSNYLLNLLSLAGFDPSNFPLAELYRRGKGLEGRWVMASPIHWQATHNDALITAEGETLGLSDTQSRIWFMELSPLLSHEGQVPVYIDADHWLIPAEHMPSLRSAAPAQVNHQSLTPILKAMDESLNWQRLFTEIQMALASHPLNSGAQTQPFVNGLWFWGGGACPAMLPKPLYTDSLLLQQAFAQTHSLDDFIRGQHQNAIVVISKPNDDLSAKIKTKTKKQAVNWYWNNIAFEHKLPFWRLLFTRG